MSHLTDVETLRRQAREHIDDGPITDAHGADRERVIDALNEVLATEIGGAGRVTTTRRPGA